MLLNGLSLRDRLRPRLGLRTLLASLVKLLLRLRLSRARPLRRGGGERESLEGERRRDADRGGLWDRDLYGDRLRDRLRDRDSTPGDRDREGIMNGERWGVRGK